MDYRGQAQQPSGTWKEYKFWMALNSTVSYRPGILWHVGEFWMRDSNGNTRGRLTRDRSCFPCKAGIIFPSGAGRACWVPRSIPMPVLAPGICWKAACPAYFGVLQTATVSTFEIRGCLLSSELGLFLLLWPISLSFHPEQTSWTRDAAEEIWPFSRKPAVAVTAVSRTLSVTSHYHVSCYCCLLFQESHHLLALSVFHCPVSSCPESHIISVSEYTLSSLACPSTPSPLP